MGKWFVRLHVDDVSNLNSLNEMLRLTHWGFGVLGFWGFGQVRY
jgi:hypothetical protein